MSTSLPMSCRSAGDHQAVAVLVAGLGGQAVGGALRGHAVQAEALGRRVPDRRALEEVEGPGARGEGLHGLGRQQLDRVDDALHLAAGLALDLVGQAHDGDDEGDVGLHGRDQVRGRDALLGDERSRRLRDSARAGKTSSASKAR
jgi:hypothetical protein